jgi:hypothetical protein
VVVADSARRPEVRGYGVLGGQARRAVTWWIEELKKKRLADPLVRGVDRFA